MSAADSAVTLACERLASSRESLRQAMRSEREAQGTPSPGPAWLESLKTLPGFEVVFSAARAWWRQHPLRDAALALSDAVKTMVGPTARRHPLVLMLGALLLGALAVRVRPWRWFLTPALIGSLTPHILRSVVASGSVQTWMGALAAHLATAPPQQPRSQV